MMVMRSSSPSTSQRRLEACSLANVTVLLDGAEFIAHKILCRRGAAILRFRWGKRQKRKQQLRNTIRFFEVRVAGKDERINAEVGVLQHALRDCRWVTYQRGSRPAAHQPDTRPKIWADFEVGKVAANQGCHALLPFRIKL